MPFQIVSSMVKKVPATGSYNLVWTLPGRTLVSLGWQNGGNQTKVYVSQMFIQAPDSAFYQFVNTSDQAIDVAAWGIAWTDSADAAPGTDIGEFEVVEEGRLDGGTA